jgi:hypothetical protein
VNFNKAFTNKTGTVVLDFRSMQGARITLTCKSGNPTCKIPRRSNVVNGIPYAVTYKFLDVDLYGYPKKYECHNVQVTDGNEYGGTVFGEYCLLGVK